MRKSVLLAGSALAVAGLTTAGAQKAEAAEISLSMYMPFVIGVNDSDVDTESQVGFGASDTELWVTGSETLENGIDVAVKFQFNADQNSSPSSNTPSMRRTMRSVVSRSVSLSTSPTRSVTRELVRPTTRMVMATPLALTT